MECCPDLPNLPNLRDLGGFPAAGGKTVRSGLVFRSDDLASLSDEETARLAKLNLRTVVDFRSRQETLYAPDILPSTVTNVIALPIDAGRLIDNAYGGSLNRRKSMGIMISAYRQLATDFIPLYSRFFAALAAADSTPLLFHCAAGKDRTGFAAALFLTALGVERKRVIEDYLLSAALLSRKYVKGVEYDDVMEPMYTVFPEFLDAAFAVVDAAPGGADGYLRDSLGVDAEALREKYTE